MTFLDRLEMNTPLSISPFPPLKPNVRYRTAMERAGFDVAFVKPPGSRNGSNTSSTIETRSSSVEGLGFGMPVSRPNTYSKSVPLLNSNHSGTTASLPSSVNRLPSEPVSKERIPLQRNSSHFDFEKPSKNCSDVNLQPNAPLTSRIESNTSSAYNTPQVGSNQSDFPVIDPVELSFKQLTKNTDENLKNQEALNIYHERQANNVNKPVAKNVYKNNPASVNFAPNEALTHATSLHLAPNEALTHATSVNFAPNAALNQVLGHRDKPSMPAPQVELPKRFPNILVTGTNSETKQVHHDDFLRGNSEIPEIKENSLGLNGGLRQLEQEEPKISVPAVEMPIFNLQSQIPFNDNVVQGSKQQGKLTAVEKLIAELDTVSLNRDQEITNSLQTDFSPKNNHLKKSSAYLSRYEPQEITVSAYDEGTLMSLQSNSTPTFYNFKKDDRDKDYNVSNNLSDPKNSFTNLHNLNDTISPLDFDTDEPTAIDTQSSPIFESQLKYPPGQGPCRRCCKEITGKGIYSKHDNELSGQWHRRCFKCIVCEKSFSKSIPCYILNDQPYCQQHFHEKNNSICKICNDFIEGECLENDKSERFHITCLKCFICQNTIGHDYYVFNHIHTICSNHDINSLVKHGIPSSPSTPANLGRTNTISKRRTRLINFH